jgi:hypothetical protein
MAIVEVLIPGLPGPMGPAMTIAGPALAGRISGTGELQRIPLGTGLEIVNGALTVTGGTGGGYPSLSMPTGFSVGGSGTATIAVTFATGYRLLTTAEATAWNQAASDSREWSAATVTQVEAEAGSSTARLAFTPQRVFQAIAAWWSASAAATKLAGIASGATANATDAQLRDRATHTGTQAATTITGLAGVATSGAYGDLSGRPDLGLKADLVNGVVPTSQIPAIAISEFLGTVSSQAAMLALSGQRGDWAIRTDRARTWVLIGDDASQLANWAEMPVPTDAVTSVNSQIGAVVLGYADVGAASAAQGAKADTAIQPGDAALTDAREWSASTVSQAEAEAGTATTRRAFTAQRVRQAIEAWWAAISTSAGRALVEAATAAAQRTALGAAASGAVTGSGITMATARLLGRTTASTGALEEITVGSGLTLTAGTLTATATGGGTRTLQRFTPRENQPPAANFATLNTRNSIAVLEFDAATQESSTFVGVIPEGANLASGLLVRIWWMGATATSGNVRWGASFEATGTDLDADSFDTVTQVTSTASGTSGVETVAEITCTAIDSLATGNRFRLRIDRIAADASNDTMTGDAQLVAVEVRGVA